MGAKENNKVRLKWGEGNRGTQSITKGSGALLHPRGREGLSRKIQTWNARERSERGTINKESTKLEQQTRIFLFHHSRKRSKWVEFEKEWYKRRGGDQRKRKKFDGGGRTLKKRKKIGGGSGRGRGGKFGGKDLDGKKTTKKPQQRGKRFKQKK